MAFHLRLFLFEDLNPLALYQVKSLVSQQFGFSLLENWVCFLGPKSLPTMALLERVIEQQRPLGSGPHQP